MSKSARKDGYEFRFALFIGSVLLFALAVSAQQKSVATVASEPSTEVRALWVVRNTLTSPEKIRAMVQAAKQNGFNTLIVQVRGRGDSYYHSKLEPRAVELKDQPADFDPLATTIAEARPHGLKIHAWVNTSLLANLDVLPTDPKHVYNRHPEWLAVPRPVAAELYQMSPRDVRYRERIVAWSKANKAELEGIYTGPANRQVRDHIRKIWLDIARRYAVDGIHFDYVRLASPDFDYSRTSLNNFRKWLEPKLNATEKSSLRVALNSNPLAAAETYAGKFADFQRDQITTLVSSIYRDVKRRKPNLIVSAAVFANDENAYTRRFQDWKRWLAMGVLDVVCPMAYSTDTAIFQKQIELAANQAHAANRKVWAGIGAYRIVAESTVEKIKAARGVGSDGIILFSYDFTVRTSDLNQGGDYLERVRRSAFDQAAVPSIGTAH